jgi:hypothetical protein
MSHLVKQMSASTKSSVTLSPANLPPVGLSSVGSLSTPLPEYPSPSPVRNVLSEDSPSQTNVKSASTKSSVTSSSVQLTPANLPPAAPTKSFVTSPPANISCVISSPTPVKHELPDDSFPVLPSVGIDARNKSRDNSFPELQVLHVVLEPCLRRKKHTR